MEFQNKLLNKAIADKEASASQKEAKATLIRMRLDFNFQKNKLLKSISDKVPPATRKVAKDVLTYNPYIALKLSSTC